MIDSRLPEQDQENQEPLILVRAMVPISDEISNPGSQSFAWRPLVDDVRTLSPEELVSETQDLSPLGQSEQYDLEDSVTHWTRSLFP